MSTITLDIEKKKILVPQLRFQEFKEEWKNKSMRDLTKINQGLQIPISERFYEKAADNYFYITNEFLRKDSSKSYFIKNPSESVICYEDDILMTRTGNTGQVVTGVHGAFHNNFFKIKYDETCSKWFLYFFLTSHKTQHTILKLAGTSTIPDLNHGDFYKITLNIPTLPEQQKIASFLSAVDEKIQQLSRKKELLEQYKKGVMQQLFSGKLRFKDENGEDYPEWEEKKLGDLVKIKSGNSPSDYQFINDGIYPFIKVEELNNCSKYQKNSRFYSNDDKNLIEAKSVIFPKRGAAILNNKVRINDCSILMDSNMMALIPLRKELDVEFLYSKIVTAELFKIADTSSIPQINNKHIEPYIISSPCLEEQQKIADFLSSIDVKIESVNQQITQTQSFKKGLLQRMFV